MFSRSEFSRHPLILWAMSNDFRAGCLSVCSADDSHLSFIRGSRYSQRRPNSHRVRQK